MEAWFLQLDMLTNPPAQHAVYLPQEVQLSVSCLQEAPSVSPPPTHKSQFVQAASQPPHLHLQEPASKSNVQIIQSTVENQNPKSCLPLGTKRPKRKKCHQQRQRDQRGDQKKRRKNKHILPGDWHCKSHH